MGKIRIAVVGVGNCASALIQGIGYYRKLDSAHSDDFEEFGGLIHRLIGPYGPGDIEVVAAFDIDRRKVGKEVAKAIFEPPNCTPEFFQEVNGHRGKVHMSPLFDGYPRHMQKYPDEDVFLPSSEKPEDVRKILDDTGTEILVNFLPVGSQKATEFYAQVCLDLRIGMANCIPVFIASNDRWSELFREKEIPIIGDDVKSQLGATIVHRSLAKLFADRGITTERTYQLNTGGNTDFLNMLNSDRLASKKISKTESVRSVMKDYLDDENIHVGPSDYVPWQKDNKVCFIRLEGKGFGGAPINLELRLSVIDSPNSAGVVIDVIRCLKLAQDAKIGGPLIEPSSYFMKHPFEQYPDEDARVGLEDFIDRAVRLRKHDQKLVEAVSKSSPR
jgi:myo-inositol-1-phosphate synthase